MRMIPLPIQRQVFHSHGPKFQFRRDGGRVEDSDIVRRRGHVVEGESVECWGPCRARLERRTGQVEPTIGEKNDFYTASRQWWSKDEVKLLTLTAF